MLFNSIEYMIFLPLVATLYYILPSRFRWPMLLVASYYFYMSWYFEYIILIVISTLVAYFISIQLEKVREAKKRSRILVIGVFLSLGLLFIFKYLDFFCQSITMFLGQLGISYDIPKFNFVLPVGISFYTFQIVGYYVDVYRGDIEPEKHFGTFALFVSFFPQLLAGPIERSYNLLPQIKKKFDFDYERIKSGVHLIMWGLFKKMVIADRLVIFVNEIYGNVHKYTGLTLILATYFFAYQLYCDFSGYTDIARGSARILGIELMENFRRPFHAQDPLDFWHRWHISLSTWIRDYIYFPLASTVRKQNISVIITMALMGLWHGAGWNFIIWGLYWAIVQIIYQGLKKLSFFKHKTTMAKAINAIIMFHVICFSLIIFRAESFSDTLYVINHLFTNIEFKLVPVVSFDIVDLNVIICSIFLLEFVHLVQRKHSVIKIFTEAPIWFRWAVYYMLIFGNIVLGRYYFRMFYYYQF